MRLISSPIYHARAFSATIKYSCSASEASETGNQIHHSKAVPCAAN